MGEEVVEEGGESVGSGLRDVKGHGALRVEVEGEGQQREGRSESGTVGGAEEVRQVEWVGVGLAGRRSEGR